MKGSYTLLFPFLWTNWSLLIACSASLKLNYYDLFRDEVSSTTRAPNHKEHPHLAQLNILQALKNSGQLEDILLPNPLAAGIGDQK